MTGHNDDYEITPAIVLAAMGGPFDAADYLKTTAAIAAYLTEALETDDPAYIRKALDTIARAKGIPEPRASVASVVEVLALVKEHLGEETTLVLAAALAKGASMPPEVKASPAVKVFSDDAVLSKSQTSAVTNLSRDTLDRMNRMGEGPKRMQLSERRVGYRMREIRKWLESR